MELKMMKQKFVGLALGGILVLTSLALSCGGGGGKGGEGGTIPGAGESREFTVSPDSATVVELKSGAKISFPVGCFTQPTIIIFSDNIVGPGREVQTYPEGTQSFQAYVTINNPASENNTFQKDITVTFAMRSAVTAGTKFIVYRFNPESVKWERFGSALAVVDSSGVKADAVLPTTGISYTIGGVGIFVGLTSGEGGNLPGGAAGIVTGIVREGSQDGDPVDGVDLLLFLVSDGELTPYDFLNGEPDPDNPNFHNMTKTDATGRYEIRFGESDIGAGKLYKLIIARHDGRYQEAESSVFSVSQGINPDKDFVVVPAS